MRVLLIGAAGAIGKALVPALVAAGHEVIGTSRTEDRLAGIEAAGASGAVCDILDPGSVAGLIGDRRPEVVINEATDLPAKFDPRKRDAYIATNRIRSEGTRNLVAALEGSGVRRVIAQSIAFTYAPIGGPIKSEDDPLATRGEGQLVEVATAVADLEGQITGIADIEGLVLRYGFIYGPGTYYAADGSQAEDFRRRRFPMIGQGQGISSFIHVDDAASATVLALDRGAPGIYNVVDDDPAPANQWMIGYATALGAGPPRRIPGFIARLIIGGGMVAAVEGIRGASNLKAKGELGWTPAHPSWRSGFSESLG